MIEFGYSELNGAQPETYQVAKKVAIAARDFACDLNSRYPGWASTGALPGSPADTWTQAFWQDVCGGSAHPPPTPSVRGVNGGQCSAWYNVTGFIKYKNVDPVTIHTVAHGKIGGLTVYKEGNQSIYAIVGTDENGNSTYYPFGVGWTDPEQIKDLEDIGITSVVRQDGQSDNCGEGSPYQYPPVTYRDPPDSDRNKSLPVPLPTNPNNKNWKFSVPLFFIENNFNFKVDVGGVTVKFDLGGVKIDLGNKNGNGDPGSFDGSGNNFPTDYATKNDVAGAKNSADAAKNAADGAKTSADGAKKAADDAARNKSTDPRNDSSQQDKEYDTEDDPKNRDGIDRLLYVDVTLSQIPKNAKKQWGGGSLDIIYAGWFEFKSKGKPLPRQPIHYTQSRFQAPIGADGFAYTVYEGFKSFHTVVTAKNTT